MAVRYSLWSDMVGNPEDRFSRVAAHIMASSRENLSLWFPPRSDMNQAVQSQRMAERLKFQILILQKVGFLMMLFIYCHYSLESQPHAILMDTHDIGFEPRSEKTGLRVSDQVRHKPGCTTIQDG